MAIALFGMVVLMRQRADSPAAVRQLKITLNHVRPPGEGEARSVCLTGKGACPPEDCGGIWDEQLLETLASLESQDHDELMDWGEESFDPEAFDLPRPTPSGPN